MTPLVTHRPPADPPKTFPDLLEEVYDPESCTYCLACLAACSREGCENVSLVGDRFAYTPADCEGDGMCYVSCPELDTLDRGLEVVYGTEEGVVGHVAVVTSVASAEWPGSGEGGVVASLLRSLLEADEIDAAGVPAPGETVSGFRLVEPGDDIVTHTPESGFRKPDVVLFLRNLHRSGETVPRLALVAPPCQIWMVRKMQMNRVPPSLNAVLLIGPFCYGTLSNARWRRGVFERALDPRGRMVESVEIHTDRADVAFHDGTRSAVDLDALHNAFDSSCLTCTDYPNRLADLSVGPVGSPPGFETVLARTEAGELVLAGALEAGFLVEWTDLYRRGVPGDVEESLLEAVEGRTAAKAHLAQGRRPSRS